MNLTTIMIMVIQPVYAGSTALIVLTIITTIITQTIIGMIMTHIIGEQVSTWVIAG